MTSNYQTEFKKLLKLFLPILLAQFALMSLGVVDTLMSGQVGVDDLAAIGLGSSIFMPIMIFGTGVIIALTPLTSALVSDANYEKIRHYFTQGLWLGIPLGLVTMLLMFGAPTLLDLLALEPVVYWLTADYLFYLAFGMPGLVFYMVMRAVWEGLEQTLPTMGISLFALFLNIPLNYVFIYGIEGMIPAYGAAGCGIASAIVMWIMAIMAVIYLLKSNEMQPFMSLMRFERLYWQGGLLPILALGIPISLAILFEVGLFSFIAVFITELGTNVLAGHQVAISYTSLLFTVPLSLGMALTIRVGVVYGRKQFSHLKQVLMTGLISATVIGVVSALATYLFMHDIVALYTDNEAVMEIAVTLLFFAVAYHLFDAIQVTIAAAMRGLQKTHFTMWVTFVCYWGIGLGGGWLFTFTSTFVPAMGVSGFWLGILLGFIVSSLLLSAYLFWMSQQLKLQWHPNNLMN